MRRSAVLKNCAVIERILLVELVASMWHNHHGNAASEWETQASVFVLLFFLLCLCSCRFNQCSWQLFHIVAHLEVEFVHSPDKTMPEPVDTGKPVWKLLQSYLWWPVRSWLSIAVGVTLLRILLTYMLSSLSMSDFSRRLLSSVTCFIASCNFATAVMFCFFILRHIILLFCELLPLIRGRSWALWFLHSSVLAFFHLRFHLKKSVVKCDWSCSACHVVHVCALEECFCALSLFANFSFSCRNCSF